MVQVKQIQTDAEFEELKKRLWKFMHEEIYPNEQTFLKQNHEIGISGNEWTHSQILMELQVKAKQRGLWNMFLPIDSAQAAGAVANGMSHGLTNLQYAEICEILGTSTPMEFASECTNCTSPDTGNMEVLCRYANDMQKKKWLVPLLEGKIRSAFAMTEPDVASSDATNIGISITRDTESGEYIINGRKWWITGSLSLHCKIMILMGKTDPDGPKFSQQSQILVPTDTPGITFLRPMLAMGDADSPKGHAEILFENVRVPFENALLGEGRGFEISQGRLGPGRIHHCMRLIGQAERALAAMCTRANQREAFGKKFTKFDTIMEDIAKIRVQIETCRLLVQQAADQMDKLGNKDGHTRQLLSLMKAHVPVTVQDIVDKCIQAFGGMGVSQDTPLFQAFAGARILRIADGPDAVHWRTAARIELSRQAASPLKDVGTYPAPDWNTAAPFRRSGDPISLEAQKKLEAFEALEVDMKPRSKL